MKAPVDTDSRRGFFAKFAALAGVIAAAGLSVPFVRYIFAPLGARRRSAFVPVAKSESVTGDLPFAAQVMGERVDAWTRSPSQRLGLVWLRRKEDGRVLALQSECPHLGCGIRLEAERRRFACPCHESFFDFEGRALEGPSPRGMDTLEVREENGQISVQFERFRTQSPRREPLG